MLNVNINNESISIAEISQLKKENELLRSELVHFIKKYMETSSLLKEGLDIIKCCEEHLQQLEDKLFWADEARRLYNEGWNYKDALEIVRIEENIQKFLRRRGVI
ncbi:MAG: hypothetical protein E7211_09770 [Clostridium lundense]|nr:hypothetical protein [Clostridium lundense]